MNRVIGSHYKQLYILPIFFFFSELDKDNATIQIMLSVLANFKHNNFIIITFLFTIIFPQ